MKQKTKFVSGYDKSVYMSEMTLEFLTRYENVKSSTLNRSNAELIGMINDYLGKYTYFQRISHVVLGFIQMVECSDKDMYVSIIKIKTSVKKQMMLLWRCKKILKNAAVETRYVEPIRYSIEAISKRIDYLNSVVIPSYIEMTPIKEYDNYLVSIGSSLYKDITENLDVHMDSSDEQWEEKVKAYCQRVISSLSKSGDWEDAYNRYKSRMQKIAEVKARDKEKERLKKVNQNKSDAEEVLIRQSGLIRRNLELNMARLKRSMASSSLSIKLGNFKNKGYSEAKLVLLANVRAGKRAKVWYYSADEEDYLVGGVIKSTLLPVDARLPKVLEDKIKRDELVMVEVVL